MKYFSFWKLLICPARSTNMAKDHVFEKADRFTERQKEKEAQAAKTEKAGKEQPDQKPKTKKHDMEL